MLIEGSHPEDTALADAYRRARRRSSARDRRDPGLRGHRRRAAHRFGPTCRCRRRCRSSPSARPSTTCSSPPTRTRSSPAYLPYHTWDPRPVAGSAGLRPTTWHPAMEAWGGTQLQTRFEKQAGRPMRPEDYNVWMALRAARRGGDPRRSRPTRRRCATISSAPTSSSAAFKGQPADVPRLGRPAAPADPARRGQRRGLGLAAGRVSCTRSRRSTRSASTARRPTARSTDPERQTHAQRFSPPPPSPRSARAGRRLHGLCQQRARQFDHHHRQRDDGGGRGDRRSASGRAASTSAPTASGSISSPPTTTTCRCWTPRPASSATALPSGPDPELGVLHPSRQPALRGQRGRQPRHRDRRRGPHDPRRDPGRHRARGHGHQPGRQGPGQHLRDHQHGAFHRHRDRRDLRQRAGRPAPALRRSSPTTASCSTSAPRSAARSA